MQSDVEKVITSIEYIEKHLSEKLDLEIVAGAVHYSKYYLHRIFTKTVGLTIHDYVQRRQLTEAAKLLVFSDKPIRYVLNENPMTVDKDIDWQNDIRFAKAEDIPKWLDLVRLVIDGFPHLDEEQYSKQLNDYINEKRALILMDGDLAIGIMGITPEIGSIDFLGVHPQYRKKGITQAFLKKAFSLLIGSTEISVTTFREGDKADPGYRNIFKTMGFAEAELLIEYGYPAQRFVLEKSDLEDSENE